MFQFSLILKNNFPYITNLYFLNIPHKIKNKWRMTFFHFSEYNIQPLLIYLKEDKIWNLISFRVIMKNFIFDAIDMFFNKRILFGIPCNRKHNIEKEWNRISHSYSSDIFLIKLHCSHDGNIVIVKKRTVWGSLKNSIRWMTLLNIT